MISTHAFLLAFTFFLPFVNQFRSGRAQRASGGPYRIFPELHPHASDGRTGKMVTKYVLLLPTPNKALYLSSSV